MSNGPSSGRVLGPKDVYIANVNPGEVRYEFMVSIINLLFHDTNNAQRVHSFIPRKAGANLGAYRNFAVEEFLKTDCEYILFLDSDHEFPPEILYQLLTHASPDTHPVVSGTYVMMLNEGLRLNLFRDMPQQLPTGEVTHTLEAWPVEDIPEDTLVQVDGTGAGCLLIHRALLEAMGTIYPFAQKWFGEAVIDGIIYGEDFTFCRRVTQMGFPIMVHTGIELGHVKSVALSPRQVKEGVKNGN